MDHPDDSRFESQAFIDTVDVSSPSPEPIARERAAEALPAPIFVGGAPRSGTTLLRVMLDSHPGITCGPELRAIPALAQLSAETRALMGDMLAQAYCLPRSELDQVFADLIRSFLVPLHQQSGKRRIAEKTPANALHFAELARLFPDSAFIQIIRDGRDVVASLLEMDWRDTKTGQPLPITEDPQIAAAAWVRHVEGGRAAKAAGVRYFEIRYEDIVAGPRRALKPLFRFLDEPWTDDILAFHANSNIDPGEHESSANQVSRRLYSDSVGRWRRELTPAAKAAVKNICGDLLIETGYASDFMW